MTGRLVDQLRTRLPRPGPALVLPEGDDPRVLEAALRAGAAGIARPLLLGDDIPLDETATRLGIDPAVVEVRSVDDVIRSVHVERYAQERKVDPRVAARLLRRPAMAAAAIVRSGEADTLMAGATASTAEIIMACDAIIGLQADTTTTSSFFVLDTTDGRSLLFADCAVNPDPTAAQLADIAVQTARSAQHLFAIDPRVALLSFSTRGSADHPDVTKVRDATRLARLAAPDLAIDGELQGDAALDLATAQQKMGDIGPVAGRANVLIFPTLDAGNIAYKLVRALGHATAVGVILQGYRKPVSDVSRGATVEELVDTAVLLAALCNHPVDAELAR